MSRGLPSNTGPGRHAVRVALVMLTAAVALGWLAVRAEIVFADGLRYIEQARRLERGDWHDGVRQAVDHPLYPLAVAVMHRARRLSDSPPGWQAAAQGASLFAGVLLVMPLYLVARSLFGGSGAWLACLLVYLAPVPAHVMADGLSESTFLLFWTWGVWAALRFLRAGSLTWLGVALGFGGLAYLSRPEGLLLPAALVATLSLAPVVPAARLEPRRWWNAVLLLVLGATAMIGPFVALKGGIGTKPAVSRLLGLAPPSPRDAVERERPLDHEHSTLATAALAVRATTYALRGAVTLPLLPFAVLGLAVAVRRRWAADARAWLFLGVVVVGSLLALARLHATGGYCTPRHALLVALPLFAAAAAGLRDAAAGVLRWLRHARAAATTRQVFARLPGIAGLALLALNLPALVEPVNAGRGGYREAGAWLAQHLPPGARVVDVTGWSLFYGERPGYVFANLDDAPADPDLRWVVVREAHLRGPWGYCERLRGLVAGARPVARFPADPRLGASRVTVYERLAPGIAPATARRDEGARPAPLR